MSSKHKIHLFKNREKALVHEDEDLENIANLRRGFKMLISGSPHVGKTNMVRQFIIHKNPAFDRILVVHVDPSTIEYDDIDGVEMVPNVADLPAPEDINPEQRLFIILEDLDVTALKRHDRDKINMYLRYVCSHRGVSLCMICHNPFAIPVDWRKKIDVYILYRFDSDTLTMLARRMGIQKDDFRYLFKNCIKTKYDSLMIDLTGSDNLVRKNIFEVVKRLSD